MTISQAVQELYKKYVQATKMEHIRNPLAWALFKVWRMADGKKNARKITNFDRIKGMSVDEMVGFFKKHDIGAAVWCVDDCHDVKSEDCRACVKRWLESEVTDDDT